MDTEDPYTPGSEQYAWISSTLAAVDRSVTPWLFLVLHRCVGLACSPHVPQPLYVPLPSPRPCAAARSPVICSDTSEEGAHIPGSGISAALEPMLMQVRLVLGRGMQGTALNVDAVHHPRPFPPSSCCCLCCAEQGRPSAAGSPALL
jgi:hypothetical protein